MKVIKIIKKFNCGEKEHFLVLLDGKDSKDDAYYAAERWCERDVSGQNYGYSWDWSFVKDLEVINQVLKDNMARIDRKIEDLEILRSEIVKNYIEL